MAEMVLEGKEMTTWPLGGGHPGWGPVESIASRSVPLSPRCGQEQGRAAGVLVGTLVCPALLLLMELPQSPSSPV